jgi:hypothetical protein
VVASLAAALLCAALFLPGCGQSKKFSLAGAVSLCEVDGFIYFTYNGGLYSETPDFSRQNRIVESGAGSVFYYDGQLGYVDTAQDDKLTSVLFEGSNRTVLSESAAAMPVCVGDTIFFINQSDDDRLYRLKPATGEAKALTEEAVVAFNISELGVFYATKNALYRIGMDNGAEVQQLCKGKKITKILPDTYKKTTPEGKIVTVTGVYFVQDGMVRYRGDATGDVSDVLDGTDVAIGEAVILRRKDGTVSSIARSGETHDYPQKNCTALVGVASGWVYYTGADGEGTSHFYRMQIISGEEEVLV